MQAAPSTSAIVASLKAADEDFEFYPTTDEILGAMVRDLKAIRYRSVEHERRRYSTGYREYASLLDVGAGNGRTLEKIRDYLCRSESMNFFSRLYAIEKSPILCELMDPGIFIVGTALEEQSLLNKPVDVVFCNPPYSIFASWMEKIIREAAAPLVYLVVPDRWEKDPAIAAAIAFRGAETHIVGHYDFEQAERRARCHVHLLRIALPEGKDDAFERFFDSEFADLRAAFDAGKEREAGKRERERDGEEAEQKKRSRFGHLVVGPNYPEAMVSLYTEEMARVRRNYDAIKTLDPELMRELGVSPAKIMECLRLRLDGLRTLYWKEMFDHLTAITDRLTRKKRRELLDQLNAHCHVDFTLGNIHAVVIWVLKNANQYLSAQLLETFDAMVSKANVTLYKSNQRAFTFDRWRYQEDKPTHFCLEYRLVLHHLGGMRGGYFEKGLSERSADFLLDLCTVARNLGFQNDTADRRLLGGRGEWVGGKAYTFTFSKPKPSSSIARGVNGDTSESTMLFEVRAFLNGNLHVRLHQRLALALNVEVGRLRGWVKDGAEAARETGIPEAAQVFGSHLCLPTGGSNLLALMSGSPAPEPAPEDSCHTPSVVDVTPAEPEPEPATEPAPMTRFNPLTGKTTALEPAPTTTPRKRAASPGGDLKKALTLLWAYTDHTGDIWRLAGRQHVSRRVAILAALTGRRVPQKDAGITAVEDLLFSACGITGETPNERERKFAQYVAGFMGAPCPAAASPTVLPNTVPAAPAAPAPAPAAAPAALTRPVAVAAMRVPLATYAALVPGLTDAEGHRFAFAHFCQRHDSWTDWREAHLAYLHPKAEIDAPTAERMLARYPTPAAEPEAEAEAAPAPEAPAVASNVIAFPSPASHPTSLDARVQKFLASLRR